MVLNLHLHMNARDIFATQKYIKLLDNARVSTRLCDIDPMNKTLCQQTATKVNKLNIKFSLQRRTTPSGERTTVKHKSCDILFG